MTLFIHHEFAKEYSVDFQGLKVESDRLFYFPLLVVKDLMATAGKHLSRTQRVYDDSRSNLSNVPKNGS
jgi:hypothetical protein